MPTAQASNVLPFRQQSPRPAPETKTFIRVEDRDRLRFLVSGKASWSDYVRLLDLGINHGGAIRFRNHRALVHYLFHHDARQLRRFIREWVEEGLVVGSLESGRLAFPMAVMECEARQACADAKAGRPVAPRRSYDQVLAALRAAEAQCSLQPIEKPQTSSPSCSSSSSISESPLGSSVQTAARAGPEPIQKTVKYIYIFQGEKEQENNQSGDTEPPPETHVDTDLRVPQDTPPDQTETEPDGPQAEDPRDPDVPPTQPDAPRQELGVAAGARAGGETPPDHTPPGLGARGVAPIDAAAEQYPDDGFADLIDSVGHTAFGGRPVRPRHQRKLTGAMSQPPDFKGLQAQLAEIKSVLGGSVSGRTPWRT
jgi:hypothetical protein